MPDDINFPSIDAILKMLTPPQHYDDTMGMDATLNAKAAQSQQWNSAIIRQLQGKTDDQNEIPPELYKEGQWNGQNLVTPIYAPQNDQSPITDFSARRKDIPPMTPFNMESVDNAKATQTMRQNPPVTVLEDFIGRLDPNKGQDNAFRDAIRERAFDAMRRYQTEKVR